MAVEAEEEEEAMEIPAVEEEAAEVPEIGEVVVCGLSRPSPF